MGIVKEQALKLQTKQAVTNSIILINALLDLHKKYSDIIKRCFSDHKLFVQAMDEAFTKFINVEVGAFTMAELLNFYVDHIFKGNEKLAEDQLEDTTEAVVRLFTYFDDKDLFYAAFRRSLSKRLLSRKINEDAERNFIGKLKRRCGEVFTKKLEGMFNDIKISTEKKDEFKEYCKNTNQGLNNVDLSVIVLNDLYWPLTKQTDLHLGQELLPSMKAFEEYYKRDNDKKKLTWLYNQGNCVVNYNFLNEKKLKKKVDLSISCIQACILLLFNEQNTYKFEAVRDALGITVEMLKYSLSPLVFSKQRLLGVKSSKKDAKEVKEEPEETKDGGDDADGDKKGAPKKTAENLEPDDIIGIVPLRGVQKKKLQYPAGSNIKAKIDDSKKLRDKTNEERILKIELALVRVMKSRNVMNIQELIAEAALQLSKFFRPDPKIMKKRIENLMERGFMRRDEEDQRKIHYCA
jgi:cullin 1